MHRGLVNKTVAKALLNESFMCGTSSTSGTVENSGLNRFYKSVLYYFEMASWEKGNITFCHFKYVEMNFYFYKEE